MWMIWLLVSVLAFLLISWRLKKKRERIIALCLIPVVPAVIFLMNNRDVFDYAFFSTHAVFDLVVFAMIAGIVMLAVLVYLAHLAVLSMYYLMIVRIERKRELNGET